MLTRAKTIVLSIEFQQGIKSSLIPVRFQSSLVELGRLDEPPEGLKPPDLILTLTYGLKFIANINIITTIYNNQPKEWAREFNSLKK